MKTLTYLLLPLSAVTLLLAAPITEPVADYLAHALKENGDLADGYYADDQLFQLDIDLDGDGILERLITLNRDRSGKQGNRWVVYRKKGNGYERVGRVIFNQLNYYVGPIEELEAYGLLAFFPSGASEGLIISYLLQGDTIREMPIGEVVLDRKNYRITGDALSNKYFRSKRAREIEPPITIKAEEFTGRYRMKVEPITYAESVRSRLNKRDIK